MAKQQKVCGIYKITNKVNYKIYIGSSVDIYKRWKQHKYALNRNKHSNMYLQSAWNKYGESNFYFEIIEECDCEIQFEREQHYLNTLKPFGDVGYNISRRISDSYKSENYLSVKCSSCGNTFKTFSHLAKTCDKCKEEKAKEWNEEKKCYISQKTSYKNFSSLMINEYGDMEYYWECNC